jgi:hypothetical protein
MRTSHSKTWSNAPVSALAGVGKDDERMLKQAFNIKTVGDLGRNKFFRAATALVDLTSALGRPHQRQGQQRRETKDR